MKYTARTAITFTAVALAIATAGTLVSCTAIDTTSAPTHSSSAVATPSVTPAPTASVDPVEVGQAAKVGQKLDKEAAVALRTAPPADGSYAYQLDDGSWVRTNTKQPLPAAVQADVNAQAATLESGNLASGNQPGIEAVKLAKALGYYTGKKVVVIAYVPTSVNGVNTMAWCAVGDIAPNPRDVVATFDKNEAIAQTKALIAKRADAASWAIAVQ